MRPPETHIQQISYKYCSVLKSVQSRQAVREDVAARRKRLKQYRLQQKRLRVASAAAPSPGPPQQVAATAALDGGAGAGGSAIAEAMEQEEQVEEVKAKTWRQRVGKHPYQRWEFFAESRRHRWRWMHWKGQR